MIIVEYERLLKKIKLLCSSDTTYCICKKRNIVHAHEKKNTSLLSQLTKVSIIRYHGVTTNSRDCITAHTCMYVSIYTHTW